MRAPVRSPPPQPDVSAAADADSLWFQLAVQPERTTVSAPGDPDEVEARAAAAHHRPSEMPVPDGVTIHTGPGAREAAQAVGAMAFTVGRDVVLGDISAPETPASVLAHELAHVGQATESMAPAPRILRQGKPDAGTPPAPPASLVPSDDLAGFGIELPDDDRKRVMASYPNGYHVVDRPVLILSARSGTAIQSVRLRGVMLTPPAPVVGGESIIFQVGKGRSILVSSPGGRSVMFDAGSGTQRSQNSVAVQRLVEAVGLVVSAGVASAPIELSVSHSDLDHVNAVRALLARPEFSATAVRVASELISAQRGFTRMSLTAQPGQQVIEIDVTGAAGAGQVVTGPGGAVHVSRRFIDGLKLTEFRSVEAHQNLTDPNRRTYDLNRASPVTVIEDLTTGERTVLTADARGRQFSEVVDVIGEGAFRRLIGARGRLLGPVEVPHHGGEQTGPDARGFLRMLRYAFEASGGDPLLFAQTSQRFATGPSSTLGFLDAVGIDVERVQGDPSGQGQAQVVRARGGVLARVTVDAQAIRQVQEIVRQNSRPLSLASARMAEVEHLSSLAGQMHGALGATQAPAELLESLAALRSELQSSRSTLAGATDTVWDRIGEAAGGREGMRAAADTSRVAQAAQTLETQVTATSVDRARDGIEVHLRGMGLQARLYLNAMQMVAALRAGNVAELTRFRAENSELVQQSRAVLGSANVAEHVRTAWKAVRGHWTEERISRMRESMAEREINRQMTADMRILLNTSLARQQALNTLAEEAAHGHVTGGRVGAPMRSRMGAGIMAAIEILRMGAEFYQQYEESQRNQAADRAFRAAEGIGAVKWWMDRGVTPGLSLVKKSAWSGFNVVSNTMTQSAILGALRDPPPAGTPDFDRVVIDSVPMDDIQKLLRVLLVGLRDLAAWHRFNGSLPVGDAFRKFDKEWAVYLGAKMTACTATSGCPPRSAQTSTASWDSSRKTRRPASPTSGRRPAPTSGPSRTRRRSGPSER